MFLTVYSYNWSSTHTGAGSMTTHQSELKKIEIAMPAAGKNMIFVIDDGYVHVIEKKQGPVDSL